MTLPGTGIIKYGTDFTTYTVELLPLKAESHDGEDGGVDHDLHEDALGVARKVAQCPGVLYPGLVQLHGHTCRGTGINYIYQISRKVCILLLPRFQYFTFIW